MNEKKSLHSDDGSAVRDGGVPSGSVDPGAAGAAATAGLPGSPPGDPGPKKLYGGPVVRGAADICPNRPGRGHEWYINLRGKFSFCRDCGYGYPEINDSRDDGCHDPGCVYSDLAHYHAPDTDFHGDTCDCSECDGGAVYFGATDDEPTCDCLGTFGTCPICDPGDDS